MKAQVNYEYRQVQGRKGGKGVCKERKKMKGQEVRKDEEKMRERKGKGGKMEGKG